MHIHIYVCYRVCDCVIGLNKKEMKMQALIRLCSFPHLIDGRWLRRRCSIWIIIPATWLSVGQLAPSAWVHDIHEHGQQHEHHGNREIVARIAPGHGLTREQGAAANCGRRLD